VCTFAPLQRSILAMPWLRAFCTALWLDISAHDCCIPVPAYGTDARACGPKCAPPQTRCDCRDTGKECTGRETCDPCDHLGRARARHRLHQHMAMSFVGTNLSNGHLLPFGDVSADVFVHCVHFRVDDDASILRRTHARGHQDRDVRPFMPIVAHSSDNNTPEKAEASFEESDPRD